MTAVPPKKPAIDAGTCRPRNTQYCAVFGAMIKCHTILTYRIIRLKPTRRAAPQGARARRVPRRRAAPQSQEDALLQGPAPHTPRPEPSHKPKYIRQTMTYGIRPDRIRIVARVARRSNDQTPHNIGVRALEQNMNPEMTLEEERTTLALHAATTMT